MKGDDAKGYYQASYDPEAGSLKLVNIALDLQILICSLLHPSDILALRKTCKTLQLLTRRRVVWVAALHQVCLDNSLFLPSFPILDMSDVELEHAAMAPRRWIELCASFQKQHPKDSDATLRPRTTRTIEDPSLTIPYGHGPPEFFIVPGGRYVVRYGDPGIHVWDLGYTSSADCKLIASVERECEEEDGIFGYMVQATPDGMGLVILCWLDAEWSCYEIYPQSETPQLTLIAHLELPTGNSPDCLSPDRVLWSDPDDDRIIFRVWDYRVNHSISFSPDVDIVKFGDNIELIATKTAIILLCVERILVWAIPSLSSQPPDFSDHNLTNIPPLFRMAFPDDVVSHDNLVAWQRMFGWYYGSSQPLYFDILRRDSILHRFEIIVKPDLFDASLHFINTEFAPHKMINFHEYKICEDTLVACWDSTNESGVSMSSRFTTVVSHGVAAKLLLPQTIGSDFSLCPASGRYVYLDGSICRIVVADLL